MGRRYSYMDEAFGRASYDPDDEGDFRPGLVCVIMAFSLDMDPVYQVIREVCAGLGLRAHRADEGAGSGIILREIVASIEHAEFLIVDLTHERPNVYYELGYAHGVGNLGSDLLLLAKAGTNLHFDIAPLRVRYYASLDDLRQVVHRNMQEMIRATRQTDG